MSNFFTLDFVAGNACSLVAMGTDSISATRKTAAGVLWFQTLSQITYCASAIVLKGYSSAVQNAMSIFRNLAAIKKVNSKILEWTLVVLGVVLGLVFNNLSWLGLLPVVANLQYTLAVFRFKDNERALKWAFLICVLMFAVFNFAILNIVAFCANIVVAITTTVSLLRKRPS